MRTQLLKFLFIFGVFLALPGFGEPPEENSGSFVTDLVLDAEVTFPGGQAPKTGKIVFSHFYNKKFSAWTHGIALATHFFPLHFLPGYLKAKKNIDFTYMEEGEQKSYSLAASEIGTNLWDLVKDNLENSIFRDGMFRNGTLTKLKLELERYNSHYAYTDMGIRKTVTGVRIEAGEGEYSLTVPDTASGWKKVTQTENIFAVRKHLLANPYIAAEHQTFVFPLTPDTASKVILLGRTAGDLPLFVRRSDIENNQHPIPIYGIASDVIAKVDRNYYKSLPDWSGDFLPDTNGIAAVVNYQNLPYANIGLKKGVKLIQKGLAQQKTIEPITCFKMLKQFLGEEDQGRVISKPPEVEPPSDNFRNGWQTPNPF